MEPEALEAFAQWANGWLATARQDGFLWAFDVDGSSPEESEDPEAEGLKKAALWIQVVALILGSRARDGHWGVEEIHWTWHFLEQQIYGSYPHARGVPFEVRLDGYRGQVYLALEDLDDIDFSSLVFPLSFYHIEVQPDDALEPDEAEDIFTTVRDSMIVDDPPIRIMWEWEECTPVIIDWGRDPNRKEKP